VCPRAQERERERETARSDPNYHNSDTMQAFDDRRRQQRRDAQQHEFQAEAVAASPPPPGAQTNNMANKGRAVSGYCFPLAAVVVLVGAYFVLGETGNLGRLYPSNPPWPGIDAFVDEDPYNASTPEEAFKWSNDNNGRLEIELVFAADERWYGHFEEAIRDWESGGGGGGDDDDGSDKNSIVLALSKRNETVDRACDPWTGKIKVCNDDYGETGWRGLNSVVLSFGSIVASSAKMNEYYLAGAGYEERQYTMCHEIGHGFGLPHTDEAFWNRPRGNCMDYSHNFGANMRPGAENFEFLAAMYGGGTPLLRGQSGTTGTAPDVVLPGDSARPEAERDDEEGKDGDEGRRRRKLPEWVVSEWRAIDEDFRRRRIGTTINDNVDDGKVDGRNRRKWRTLLRASPEPALSHASVVDIGEGYSIRVHELFA